jgi:hypothetical protein
VVARSTDTWFVLDTGATPPAFATAPVTDIDGARPNPSRIIDGGGCNAGDGPLVLVEYGDGEGISAYDPSAAFTPTPSAVADDSIGWHIFAAGCVVGTDQQRHRIVALSPTCPAGNCSALTLVADIGGKRTVAIEDDLSGSSLGFTTARDGVPPLLLRRVFDSDGSAIDRYRIDAPTAGALSLDRVDRDRTPLPPTVPRGGDFDADGLLDVMAILPSEEEAAGVYHQLLYAALGFEHAGERLSSITPAETSTQPLLWILDVDRDGYDDFVYASPTGLDIVLMGAGGEGM